jgi:hypothetical protein
MAKPVGHFLQIFAAVSQLCHEKNPHKKSDTEPKN